MIIPCFYVVYSVISNVRLHREVSSLASSCDSLYRFSQQSTQVFLYRRATGPTEFDVSSLCVSLLRLFPFYIRGRRRVHVEMWVSWILSELLQIVCVIDRYKTFPQIEGVLYVFADLPIIECARVFCYSYEKNSMLVCIRIMKIESRMMHFLCLANKHF